MTSWTKAEGRQTHNLPGRAYPAQVWDFYNNGCSVRMLNPQTYSNSIYEMCASLQEFFGCFVGSNTYLTPAGTQGRDVHFCIKKFGSSLMQKTLQRYIWVSNYTAAVFGGELIFYIEF